MRMKTTTLIASAAVLVSLALPETSHGQIVNPNGFPSGPHFNLNIIGKKGDYNCTPVVYDEGGLPVYGNVIFVPEDGDGIQIVMTSGKKGGKGTQNFADELQVTDACAGFDGNPAVLQLPPNENGYRVYARALAKPVGTDWTISYGGTLFSAQDEFGNDLVDLGLITDNGVASTGETVVRTKGKSTAKDITGLFLWSGTVCNIDWSGASLETRPLCWLDNLDGTIEGSVVGLIDPTDSFFAPTGEGTCAEGEGLHTQVPVICSEPYVESWIFNIADLVSSDWLVDNNGTKLVQLRFYPVQE